MNLYINDVKVSNHNLVGADRYGFARVNVDYSSQHSIPYRWYIEKSPFQSVKTGGNKYQWKRD